MQIPQAPMEQQQMMLTQQVTGQRQDRSSDTVHQFPLHSENEINSEWMSNSSDEELCMLAASSVVDQRGPFVRGKVMGRKVSFLVDTGATRSTVRSAEVLNLPLSGRTVQVVGVVNKHLTNPIADPVQVEIGYFQGLHKFVVCDSSPVSLLERDLLCNTKCLITCSTTGIEIQMHGDDEEEQAPEIENETTSEEYSLIEFFPMFTVKELHADLKETVQKNLWDLTVRNGDRIKELLYALQSPEEIVVVKCSAHLKSQDYVSLGNGYADRVARDEGEEIQEGAEESILTDMAGEHSSAGVLPEADGAEKQTEQVPDQGGEGVETDESQADSTRHEPVTGSSRENTTEKEKEKSPILKKILTEGSRKGDNWP
ncbi:hypothetical protein NDU88_003291 [Pleurodeles waltl]|uniref:Peptidase A2 domain-containing protein n=1 Tax=Pleurodeles waltl TaxID=8319 RepID=A0AAV7W5M5_PLEWA|nr:hypothetical protein NDU88_003291 [Pleurodeles waltl]